MARATPDDRLRAILRAATEVFIAQGYRRTQMSDVSAAAGLAKGTLYLYFESKEALFDLVVRNADQDGPIDPAPELPVSTPQAGETLQYVASALAEGSTFPALQAGLSRRRVADVRTELEGILRELYSVLFQHRRGLKLIDRCAQDHPDLARLWFRGGREFLLDLLVQYFDRRASRLRPVPDRAIAARMVIENLVLWAIHRHWDPAPQRMDEKVAEDTVLQFLLDALVKEVPT
jgi:AcrR family transcriptional regulator